MNRKLIAGTVAVVAAGFALARTTTCYTATWFSTTMDCETCALYTICPGSVLCTVTTTGGGIDPVVTASVSCNTYSGGTGSCTAKTCTAGVLVLPPSASVTCPRQNCPPPCEASEEPNR